METPSMTLESLVTMELRIFWPEQWSETALCAVSTSRSSGMARVRVAWVAWVINPTRKGMVGSQALIAFQQTNGFTKAYTSPVGSYRTNLEQGNLSFPVQNLDAEFVNNEIVIYATLGLPENLTTVTQVWQEGPLDGDTPLMHRMAAANRQSIGTVDFKTKKIGKTPTGAADPRLKRKNVHGVLNAVSWEILMPLGAIIARHMKAIRSAPLWFYLHIACQTSGYAIGNAGWATGMKIGSGSPARNNPHRNIGITLFTLATLSGM
ncbi:hypothetical protein Scep_012551 [Stephania cephalantha]|uniref:Cytochrome b561 and DOMON domain-containing protein n=1 Tax=Stephania cephalantha TaxID=152367 RepID=A0AAP0JH22_9MAGN